MFKKLILVGFVFLFSFNSAHAEVTINEIAWKGTTTASTHEWLELANVGESVNISGWTIKDGINQLNIILPDGAIIRDGGFYVIKRTTADITPYDLSTSFNGGLSDGGEKLILSDATGAQKQTLDFSGGWPDITMTSENTMQWNGLSWVTATPTPGTVNEITTLSTPPVDDSISSSESSSSSSSNGGSSSGGGSTNVSEIQKIKTQIIVKTFGFTGLPLSFNAKTFGLSGEQLHYGKYFWNFGDGDSKEIQLKDSQQFFHTYFYPGDYLVSLDYFSNPYVYSDVPDASSQIIIKIIKADISISRVGDEKDFFVELTNNTDYGADLSNWVLASDTKSFTIPRNTILASKKKIILSPKITNFSIVDKDTLKLMNSGREVVFDYGVSNSSLEEYSDLGRREVDNASTPSRERATPEEGNSSAGNPETEILTDNLQASVISSETVNDSDVKSSNFPTVPLVSFAFIGTSAGMVYYIRQKKVIPKDGDDFEILDE